MAAAEVDEGVGTGSGGSDDDAAPLTRRERLERDRLLARNRRRRQKRRRRPHAAAAAAAAEDDDEDDGDDSAVDAEPADDDDADDDAVEIEYVDELPEVEATDPNFSYFAKVFQAFKLGESSAADTDTERKSDAPAKKQEEQAPTKAAIVERILQEEMEQKKEREGDKQKMSKRKLRIALRPTVADLKASCVRPDVVEWHDVTARDPKLLVELKALRNTVPVPRHWCFKRKYLAGKRGFERAPFDLPDFIKRTGIAEMRQAVQEKEDNRSLKSAMREKVRPKMGRIDIDYQKLHDAFFRWQTKPKMTILGDLYFEGKELETQMREKKPGEYTDDLRIALGMPVGPNAHKFPPPWLIAMQRYGPPPSYPNLKVAGLNAPIPEGCAFGYHAGGWGKPPVDETGKPLYGDVFGLHVSAEPSLNDEYEIERRLWGQMDDDESDEAEEDDDDDAPLDGADADAAAADHDALDESGLVTPAEGLITPSGISSGVPTGVETPDSIELRKRKTLTDDGSDTPAGPLYSVLPEKRVDRVAGQMMASTHVYDLANKRAAAEPAPAGGGIDVSLNPEELDLQDPSGLQRKYDAEVRKQQQGGGTDADFSDLVAEHAARQKRKRKAHDDKKTTSSTGGTSSSTSAKKYKDFKF